MSRMQPAGGESTQVRRSGVAFIAPLAAQRELDAEDRARLVTTFRGQPRIDTPTNRYERAELGTNTSAYVFDAEAGMVYLLD